MNHVTWDARIPLSEFDGPGEAVIEPSRLIHPLAGVNRAVLCFFQDAIDRLVTARHLAPRFHLRSEIGAVPVYDLDVGGVSVLLTHPRGGRSAGRRLSGGDDRIRLQECHRLRRVRRARLDTSRRTRAAAGRRGPG